MVSIRRPTKTTAIVLATVIGLAFAGSSAAAEETSAGAPRMPLGTAAPAPEGFIHLCERAPVACATQGVVPDPSTLRAEANRRFWAAAFGQSAPIRPAVPPAAVAVARAPFVLSPVDVRVPRLFALNAVIPREVRVVAVTHGGALAPDEGGALAAGDVVASPLSVEATSISEAAAASDVAIPRPRSAMPAQGVQTRAAFAMDREGWRLVNGVNRRLNRAIRTASDARLHGREDYWTVPTGDDAQGDCEDYVLAKRVALIEAGVPTEALSIAIVDTAWGESHAVLLLASDQGEYVLDNLSPWVSRWDRVNYRWRERQVPGQPMDWVSVAL